MTTPWTDEKLQHAVQAYLQILKFEKVKIPYVKAEIIRQLQFSLPNQSHKSIEYRWQNISAVLNNNNLEFIWGFKPKSNVGVQMEKRIWTIIKKQNIIS